MPDPDTISADYSLRPGELADTLTLLVEARQPAIVWGPPGCAKSQIAQQVADRAGREYIDVRALLLDPVDLRGIPWRDGHDRTRWAPPAFLPPADGRWLVNLEELPSAVPMVQAALYQLVLDRRCGEYELPDGVALLQVDAAVQDAALYASGDLPERIAIRGRGGTHFRPGFAWLSDQGLRPGCCLYPTDMECDRYPEAEPDYPVIWCNWGPPPGERNRQPWEERIDIAP